MTSPCLDDLRLVNAKVNLLPYVAEVGDDWTPIAAAGGDCDSYATAKYERLAAIGWPREWLRLATCYVETGEYHAVLLADLDGRTWVLDNRHPWPTEFSLLPYRWHKLQIAGTRQWELA
jgi:predicted transglutaminase-like cysteine proteinase